MTTPSLIDRQRTLVRNLASLAAEKGEAEPALAARYRAQVEAADRTFAEGRQKALKRHQAQTAALADDSLKATSAASTQAAAEHKAAHKEYVEGGRAFTTRIDAEAEAAESALQSARFAANALLDAGKADADAKLCENHARLSARVEEYEAITKQAREQAVAWKQPVDALEARAAKDKPEDDGSRKISECIKEAADHLDDLRDLVLPRFLKGKRLLLLTLLLWLALVYPLGWLIVRLAKLDADVFVLLAVGAAASALTAALTGWIAGMILRSMARKQVAEVYVPLLHAVEAARATRRRLLKRYQNEHDQSLAAAAAAAEVETAKARAWEQKRGEIHKRRVSGMAELVEKREARTKACEERRVRDLHDADTRDERKRAEYDARKNEELATLEAQYRARMDEITTTHEREWQAFLARWTQLLADARDHAAAVVAASDALFPGWDRAGWAEWQAPDAPPPCLRFGTFRVTAESLTPTPPWVQPRPALPPTALSLPALCPFPEPGSVLLRARDEGREQAVSLLQTLAFRLLTSLPAGRVRFTIVDPVGLGQNFATLMNLADHDEALVGGRIWTEPAQIEHRLADVTAHLENVIQKYLRNRYATINEYNTHAGEVAEPFRVLVVANFPTNFTPEAIRRLTSIAQSGPRCGVLTLMSVDDNQPMPRDFDLADLQRACTNLDWAGDRFHRDDADFAPFPLTLDAPPPEAFANRVLQRVGIAAVGAKRVEVPFEFIAPPVADYWKGSTAKEVSVPLGRSGATRRQHLRLGKGTSQHVVVVGKTGSGKSTLLHALITNLALFYSPEEVELYLVDFKKGVEFNTYAVNELPHARVIAVESDREFGLSVLQRLDAELKERGQRFRAVGAQDLDAFRRAAPGEHSPRLMLIVDEFQEFFVDDDRIAQEASQLLDRLVRQGRAFGMHVLLGSQTVGGAYSLARSTIDQMAVRIALQCSEADAHLVLSEDNSAARLLSRPGEAIYNDANGLVEGNDPFQVVWLDDEQRDDYLDRVRVLARERDWRGPPAIVFEGNAVADVRKNPLLERALTSGPDRRNGSEEAWLGEAMAIGGLTAASFRRQNGSNLLVLGQQQEAALGMLATGVISLATHGERGDGPRFWVVDGNQADAPREGVLAELSDVLGEPVRLAGWREMPAMLDEWSAELQRRQSAAEADAPSVYLILYSLHRLRELRRREDDYGFGGRGEEKATPDKQLATILKEGASLGMHVLLWCDTLNNLQRTFDRQTLRELAMRVVFQVSVADSSNLIDSPAASKLGPNRALFCNEEDGHLQKFRPYGVPTADWLSFVRTVRDERKVSSRKDG